LGIDFWEQASDSQEIYTRGQEGQEENGQSQEVKPADACMGPVRIGLEYQEVKD
jgi:hypothetical protein